MTVSIFSCYMQGLNCSLVTIESHISRGLPSFSIVGLADASIQESKERVRSALMSSAFEFPSNHKTINLAPAQLKKHGTLFDLPIATALLLSSDQIEFNNYDKTLIVGELSLDGSVKGVFGALIVADFARKQGFERVILPESNLAEAKHIDGIEILGIKHLSQLKDISQLKKSPETSTTSNVETHYTMDFFDVRGQECAKRALIISAAGRHHVLMQGPPGCGKTLLAQTLPSILPELSFEEKIEISQIYSLKGLLDSNSSLISQRPFRAIHNTASAISIVGGGANPLPGEISLAHKGILFVDEIAEFPRFILEMLRQPLESGTIHISRASANYTFPSAFQLIAAMNPCPCGYSGHPTKHCKCSQYKIENYTKKISGPLRDRMDICLYLQPVQEDKSEEKLTSKQIRLKVEQAFLRQKNRYKNESITFNSELSPALIKKYAKLSEGAKSILEIALKKLSISMREYTKIIKLALTISDLDEVDIIGETQLMEALSYRQN